MQVDDPLHDRQPEPGARCLRPRRSIEATRPGAPLMSAETTQRLGPVGPSVNICSTARVARSQSAITRPRGRARTRRSAQQPLTWGPDDSRARGPRRKSEPRSRPALHHPWRTNSGSVQAFSPQAQDATQLPVDADQFIARRHATAEPVVRVGSTFPRVRCAASLPPQRCRPAIASP